MSTGSGGSLGWGVLGCGEITEIRGAPAIVAQPDSRIVAFQSRTRARAEEFARRFG
ncbi:MAG: gfo/Idh/MocA family oxidoreductase, partial [Armatimonadetes bacterium]|nr:gfo/Idh/MocA family oxidoreductase [Armatimonadota bacterium]